MTLEPCPFCGGEAEHAFDYVRGGDGNKYHHVVCKSDRNHIGGVGCYNAAPGRNGNSGRCDHCYKKAIECVFAARAWNTRAPDPRITELEQPCEPGSFAGDIWYGHPEKRNLGTHRWDGSAWQELPSEIEGCLSLLADARARIAAIEAEVARKDEALREIGDHNRFGWTLQTELAREALEARND